MAVGSSLVPFQYPPTPHVCIPAPFDIVEAAFYTLANDLHMKCLLLQETQREAALAIYKLCKPDPQYRLLVTSKFILRKLSANETRINHFSDQPYSDEIREFIRYQKGLKHDASEQEIFGYSCSTTEMCANPQLGYQIQAIILASMREATRDLLTERNNFQREYIQFFLDQLYQDGILQALPGKRLPVRPRGRQSEKEWLWFLAMAKEGVELREQDPSLTFGEIMARIGFNGNENTFRKYRRQFEEIRDSNPALLQKITQVQGKIHKRRPSL